MGECDRAAGVARTYADLGLLEPRLSASLTESRRTRVGLRWSAHGFNREWGVRMTRTVFRLKVRKWHADFFHGGFR